MPNFTARAVGAGAAGYYNDTSVLLPLGSPVESRDGRMYRWCSVGSSTDLVAGNVIQGAPVITNHSACIVSTVPIGATSIVFTPLGTGAAAQYYAEGYLAISVSTGLGYSYKVSSHAAITASVAFTLNLDPADPIQVATVTATSKGNLVPNPYSQVIQAPITTLTGKVAGVAPYIITKAQNGWLQTFGAASVLLKGTPAVGVMVGSPGSAAGAGVIFAAATTMLLGDTMEVGVDAATTNVYLRIG